MATYTTTTKIGEGLVMSLGRSNITPGTITVDGGPVPATMTIDLVAGTVQWSGEAGDPGPYTFQFEWEVPLTRLQQRARQLVEERTQDKIAVLDKVFVGSNLVADFMTQEVLFYEFEGRPVLPAAAKYSTATVLQSERGDADLRTTLEWMRTKYIDLKTAVNAIIAQRFNFLNQIAAATTAAEIATIETAIEAW